MNINKTSDARLKANRKYQSKFANINLRLDRLVKDLIKDRAKDLGKSVNEYIVDLIMIDLDKRD